MDLITEYNNLQKEAASNPAELILDSEKIDNFSKQVIETSKSNGYLLHSGYGVKPHVFIYGFTHSGNSINQDNQLQNILRNCMVADDLLACEGDGPSEIVYDLHHSHDLIGQLKDFFLKNRIRTIFNDERRLMIEFMLASNELKSVEENKKQLDSNYVTAVEKYLKTLRARDDNFCYHESSGLVPLIQGQAKIYQKLESWAKIFQLVGTLHIHTGNIQNNLEKSGVNYLAFLPNK